VVVVAGAGLVSSSPAGPGVAELAGGGGRRRGGQAQQAAGFGDADLDLAGVFRGSSSGLAGRIPVSAQRVG
jgi:hypothetical protein